MSTTPAERKALLFLALVAVLGGGVRLWRTTHPAHPHAALATDADSVDTSSTAPREGSSGRGHSVRKRTSSGRSGRRGSRGAVTGRDSTTIIDLDRASVADIDALGVLPAGAGRLIVADRDSFGPFGSLEELARVPFLSTAALRKLAPRVTFSRLPRPKNAVVQPHPVADSTHRPMLPRSSAQRVRSRAATPSARRPRSRRSSRA
jgi:DNA uptake protein ComE-like DNA-binding protein